MSTESDNYYRRGSTGGVGRLAAPTTKRTRGGTASRPTTGPFQSAYEARDTASVTARLKTPNGPSVKELGTCGGCCARMLKPTLRRRIPLPSSRVCIVRAASASTSCVLLGQTGSGSQRYWTASSTRSSVRGPLGVTTVGLWTYVSQLTHLQGAPY